MVSEDIMQLEQALIELDEQNTMNAIEISKREAKAMLLNKQIEECQDKENRSEDFDEDAFKTHIEQHRSQIEILTEATKQNLIKRQTMKEQLFENYNKITKIRSSIHSRIESDDVKEYLLLVIKCQFLESQNIQLLLNLQLQAKTIAKYDKYFSSNIDNMPMIDTEDLLEDEEDEPIDDDDDDYEEDKFESSNESKSAKVTKPGTGVPNGSRIPQVGPNKKQATGVKKSTLINNPYFKKNPYLVQQSKRKPKK